MASSAASSWQPPAPKAGRSLEAAAAPPPRHNSISQGFEHSALSRTFLAMLLDSLLAVLRYRPTEGARVMFGLGILKCLTPTGHLRLLPLLRCRHLLAMRSVKARQQLCTKLEGTPIFLESVEAVVQRVPYAHPPALLRVGATLASPLQFGFIFTALAVKRLCLSSSVRGPQPVNFQSPSQGVRESQKISR